MRAGFPQDLIHFLEQPDSYPHRPDSVKHIQTHISHVFIASPYVYKFKKPVDFDFLDFSTPKNRKYYCEQEVKLNSRLCDGPYLGTIPIYKRGDSWSFSEIGNQGPAEYAVWMKQLSKEDFLIEYLRKGLLTYNHLDRVVEKLVPFYKNQSPDQEILKWGEPDKIKVNTDENFEQTESFIGETISKIAYDTMHSFTNQYLDRRKNLFEQRIREGRIVDGHGDLHLEHIHFTADRVCIYDCIEFNDRFRYQDIASDIAFLSMDLDFNSLPKVSNYFINQMSEELDDPDLLRMIDFYKCYRAYIRGKVKSMESGEEEVDDFDRDKAARLARRYFSLALRYVLFGSKPAVLVFMGPVASGKSTLAKRAAGELKLKHFSSDILRKKRAGLPLNTRTPSTEREQVYSKRASDRTYQELTDHAIEEISKGHGVILDATFGNPGYRRNLVQHLITFDTDILFIEADAPDETRKKRLKERAGQTSVISDARLEDLEKLDSRYQSPLEMDADSHIKISTVGTKNQSLSNLFRTMVENRFSGV